jgi:hypothetical protein
VERRMRHGLSFMCVLVSHRTDHWGHLGSERLVVYVLIIQTRRLINSKMLVLGLQWPPSGV